MINPEQFSWQRLHQQAEALLSVLDVDSASQSRFNEQDEAGLNALAEIYLSSID